MDSSDKSAKIRNYAIAGFFIIITILAGIFFLKIFTLFLGSMDANKISVWSECEGTYANVFIGANEDIKDIKCTALDTEFFTETEIFIGDLSRGSEDVCKFKLKEDTKEPLRFEVLYNGKSIREVCDWEHDIMYVD